MKIPENYFETRLKKSPIHAYKLKEPKKEGNAHGDEK